MDRSTIIVNDILIDGGLKHEGFLKFMPNDEHGEILVNGNISALSIFVKEGFSIRVNGSINTEAHVFVSGSVFASYIDAGTSIDAGGSIEASRGSIHAGGYIKSGKFIKAYGEIVAGAYIRAEESIETKGYILSHYFSIRAKYMITKTLPFHRGYYSCMPPLIKFRDIIETEHLCFKGLKLELMIEMRKTKNKFLRQEIVEWDGWHPLIRAQLEMFFNLKNRVYLENV